VRVEPLCRTYNWERKRNTKVKIMLTNGKRVKVGEIRSGDDILATRMRVH